MRNQPKKEVDAGGELCRLLNLHLMSLKFEDDYRKKGVFHPSQICDKFCPREWSLLQLHPELAKSDVSADLRLTFDHGTWMHDMIQTYLGNCGILYGKYECNACKTNLCKTDYVGAVFS